MKLKQNNVLFIIFLLLLSSFTQAERYRVSPADPQTENLVKKIVQTYGLEQNFTVKATTDVPNAKAIIDKPRRYIFYNSSFLQQSKEKTGSYWTAVAILAHEIAHHLNGDTLEDAGSNPVVELKADKAAGAVLQKMGATGYQAIGAYEELILTEQASATHPSKNERITEMSKGWSESENTIGRIEAHDLELSENSVEKTIKFTHVTNPKDLEPKMVSIKGGCFTMGSPTNETGRSKDERQHKVCVKDFKLAETEVTKEQFSEFVRATNYLTDAENFNGCSGWTTHGWIIGKPYYWRNVGFFQDYDHPVVCVSWNDAMAYISWLNKETDKNYRLPTEAEWEYAARAGTSSPYFWGDDVNNACNFANVGDLFVKSLSIYWQDVNNCYDGYVFTAAVKLFQTNQFILYDMIGNVWEWTCSEYDENYSGKENQCISGHTSWQMVLRGGGWTTRTLTLRSAQRNAHNSSDANNSVGFRLSKM